MDAPTRSTATKADHNAAVMTISATGGDEHPVSSAAGEVVSIISSSDAKRASASASPARRAEPLGGHEERDDSDGKAAEPDHRVGEIAAVACPPMRRCRMIMMLESTIGNTARLPLAAAPMGS